MKRIVIGVLVAAAVIASIPFWGAERFRPRIHAALESALGRRVEITGRVNLGLWNGPGFSITNVVIHEDPSIGIEPFAYVASLDASVNLSGLFSGRWEVGSLVLDEPTVNLAKQDSGAWNVRGLLARKPDLHGKLPEIRVRNGRLNLKFNDLKSVLYFTNADATLSPLEEGGMRVRFSMEPSRTDRPAQGIGILTGTGSYRTAQGSGGELDLDLDLQRSALSEIATLLEGRGGGLRGFLACKAKIKGPLDNLKMDGRMRLEDIQRFDLLRAASGSWPIQFTGSLNFPAGELRVETKEGSPTLFRLSLRGHRLLDTPTWGVIASFHEFPAATVRDGLQYLGLSLPERVALEGALSGVVGYARPKGFQGMLDLPEAQVKGAGGSLLLRDARFVLDGDQIRLGRSSLTTAESRLEIEGLYGPRRQVFSAHTGSTPVAVKETAAAFQQLVGSGVPFLERLEKARWRGSLRYEREEDEEPLWNARFSLQDATLGISGLSLPVKLRSAVGSIRNGRLVLGGFEGTAGEILFAGGFQEARGTQRAHQIALLIPAAEVAALEKLFAPSLRRESGLLRTLGLRNAPAPDWLRKRRIEADVRCDAVSSGETLLGAVRGKMSWNAQQVQFSALQWERDEASGTAKASLTLQRPDPTYQIAGTFRNFSWSGGSVDGEVDLQSGGVGIGVVRNAKSNGKFKGRSILLPADTEFTSVSGSYEIAGQRGGAQLKLTGVEATSDGESFTGRGTSEPGGKLSVDLTGERRKIRLTGTVWPFQLEAASR